MREDKIAVLGDKESILAFKAIGVDVFPVNEEEEAREELKKLARKYSVIFITEDIAIKINDVVERYKAKPYPAVIPIPSSNGTNGYGMDQIHKNVEKAIGADILFGKED